MGAEKPPFILMKNLIVTLQVLSALYPFVTSIFTNDPNFYTNDFLSSIFIITSLELVSRLTSRIQR